MYISIYIYKQNRHASVDTHIPIPQATGKLRPGLLVSLGLDNFLDTVSRRPETVATRAGLRLYDVPPGKYPEEMEGMEGMEGMLKLFFWGKGAIPGRKGGIPGTPNDQFFPNWLKNRFPCKDLESYWKQPVVNGCSRL